MSQPISAISDVLNRREWERRRERAQAASLPLLPIVSILFALAFVFRVDLFFTIAWLLLGMWALTRAWTWNSARSVSIERSVPPTAVCDDEVSVTVTVRNRSRLPILYLEVMESAPFGRAGMEEAPSHVMSIRPRGVQSFTYRLRCSRRGHHQFGSAPVQIGDFLGLERRLLAVEAPAEITIFPRIVPLEHLRLPARGYRATLPATAPLFEDMHRVVGTRDYQRGDALRRIHWTASARSGQILVKQYHHAVARESIIVLDTCGSNYPQGEFRATEQAIVAAASIANHMILNERQPVGLALEQIELSGKRGRVRLNPGSDRTHLVRLLHALAWVLPGYGGDFARILREEGSTLARGGTVICITGELTREVADALLSLQRSGHACSLVLIRPDVGAVASRGVHLPPAIPAHRVWTNQDMKAYL